MICGTRSTSTTAIRNQGTDGSAQIFNMGLQVRGGGCGGGGYGHVAVKKISGVYGGEFWMHSVSFSVVYIPLPSRFNLRSTSLII